MIPQLRNRAKGRKPLGFTVLELMVATAILVVILLILVEVSSRVGDIWKSSAGRVSSFQAARAGFDAVTRALSQATLNTYFDYVDRNGNYRDPTNPTTFVPAGFKRASELHFLAGPAASFTGKSPALSPGHAVFFQAPLNRTEAPDLRRLPDLLNSVGFYLEYGSSSDAGTLPSWLSTLFGSANRFQLRQIIQPTEQNGIYESESGAAWLDPLVNGAVTPGVLADNVVLLLFRPRLSPQDEVNTGTALSGQPVTDESRGSILSPNYAYNSRAWQDPSSPVSISGTNRIEIMRNQIAPIVDVVMVAVDPQVFARFDMAQSTPPAAFTPAAGLFTDSALMEEDLRTFENQLSEAGIRYRVFRTSVPILSSKWSNSF